MRCGGDEGWVGLAQSLAFVGDQVLAVFGFFWRLSFDAPAAVGLRPRLLVSDSVFELSGFFYRHIKHNVSIVLSFYSFRPFYSLVTPASAPWLLFFAIR